MSSQQVRDSYWNLYDELDGVLETSGAFRTLQALMCIIVMLRFFKAFSMQPQLAIVTETLSRGFVDIVHFLIVFVSVFVTYALGGNVLFGHQLTSFHTMDYSLYTC